MILPINSIAKALTCDVDYTHTFTALAAGCIVRSDKLAAIMNADIRYSFSSSFDDGSIGVHEEWHCSGSIVL